MLYTAYVAFRVQQVLRLILLHLEYEGCDRSLQFDAHLPAIVVAGALDTNIKRNVKIT